MGNNVALVDSLFLIRKANQEKAFLAAKSLVEKETELIGDYPHFRYVSPDFPNAENLKEVLVTWRYSPEYNMERGDITNLSFVGENLGDDKMLFEALAPYVASGSYLQYHGEDGASWRWVFTDGKLIEVELRKGTLP